MCPQDPRGGVGLDELEAEHFGRGQGKARVVSATGAFCVLHALLFELPVPTSTFRHSVSSEGFLGMGTSFLTLSASPLEKRANT